MIDTGVVASNPEIAGRVSSLSSCAAVTFACSNGFADDEGHGTATAAIAAGQLNPNDLMSGVAPAATVLSEKVLNAQGSGYDVDVANGILKAANAGAPVISLSLTYIPTQAVVNAINYATARGAVIVWAAGNAASVINGGTPTFGLTAASLTHLIIVGSVDSANTLSSFSNTPGAGLLFSSSSFTPYASVWLMAPGESIVAPGIQFGANAYAYWTGTSMSTPEVAGAVALLEATWPILKTNGTAAAVLFASASKLGAASTYGNGLLNIGRAFQPIGAMSVATVGGGLTDLSGGGGIVGSKAFGSMPMLQAQLAHYTAFDGFERNFTVNLSRLVGSPAASMSAAASTAPPLTTNAAAGRAGQLMLIGPTPSAASAASAFQGDPSGDWRGGIAGPPRALPTYLAFAGRDGTFFALGRGVSSELSFAEAAWGAGAPAASQADLLGVTSAFAGLAQGGYSATLGVSPLHGLRLAASWSATPPPAGVGLLSRRNRSDAEAGAFALTAQVRPGWTVGVSYTALGEDNAVLGADYTGTSLLDFGDHRRSHLVSLSSALDLGGGRAILGEASLGQTDGATSQTGLIKQVSSLKSRAWGVSFVQANALRQGDDLTLSLRQPLTVTAGQAQLAVTDVDALGYPVTSFTAVSLAPTGRETDVTLGYATPAGARMSFRGAVSYRADADNIAGLTDVSLRLGLTAAF